MGMGARARRTMTDARVILWGRDIGAVSWLDDREIGVFQYVPEFVDSGIEVAPLMMPLRKAPYEFPALPRDAFKGLPGMLADSLPDRYGNILIDVWLAQQGRTPESFNPVERLCYTGARGMGALEFKPTVLARANQSNTLEVAELVDLANRILDERSTLAGRLCSVDDARVIEDIFRVGTSAGGARAKVILAWNEESGEFRSGQVPNDGKFSYWLMKFDGIEGNKDKEIADPQGYGLIEYAYYHMAIDAGIEMSECRLHREGGRAHFMTKRFDRTDQGGKLHMQSLSAMMHFDFNQADAYSYEQALQTIRRIKMPVADVEQQYRRAVFNIIARNHDDHVKNIAYLMNKAGQWRLSPAFDVAYSYNPNGAWTSRHQMSINGKRDGIEIDDLLALGKSAAIKPARARDIIAAVTESVRKWPEIADAAGVDIETAERIGKAHK